MITATAMGLLLQGLPITTAPTFATAQAGETLIPLPAPLPLPSIPQQPAQASPLSASSAPRASVPSPGGDFYPRPPQPNPTAPPFQYRRPPSAPPYGYGVPAPFNSSAGGAIDRPTQPGFPTYEEQVYEGRIRSSAMAAQGQQGPLDGAWMVSGTDGARLYFLQLADERYGGVDGAWRDANGAPGLRSGFLASAVREGAGVTFRFYEREGGPPVVLSLQPAGDGRSWTGHLNRSGARSAVIMRSQ